MKLKLAITGLLLALVTLSSYASLEYTAKEHCPIDHELNQLTMSPAERMISRMMENHPVVLVSNWITE